MIANSVRAILEKMNNGQIVRQISQKSRRKRDRPRPGRRQIAAGGLMGLAGSTILIAPSDGMASCAGNIPG